jgi:hypothetical protein
MTQHIKEKMMKRLVKLGSKALLAFAFAMPAFAAGQQIILESSIGESYVVEIEPKLSFADVVESINQSLTAVEERSLVFEGEASLPYGQGFRMDVKRVGEGFLVKASKRRSFAPRNYFAPVTPTEKNDIATIVRTLAKNNLIKIKSEETNLKRAGERIDHIHPFQFLATVFTDEELKVCMRNLQGKAFVWKSFLEGITDTLAEEHAVNNLMPFVQDLSDRIHVNSATILPLLQSGRWEKLITTLIETVPRSGSSDRYGF